MSGLKNFRATRWNFYIFLLSFWFAGCIPYVYEYYRPVHPNGTGLSSGRCSGPKDTIRIPYHGISVSVQLKAIYHLPPFLVVFYVPAGITVRLASDVAELILRSDGREERKTITLVGAHGSTTDPMVGDTRETTFLSIERVWHKDFPFKARMEPHFEQDSGTLTLPDIFVNGLRKKGLEVAFRRERSLEFDALNC